MKRLMLGFDEPTLLVEIVSEEEAGFEFYVVNGDWEGAFRFTSKNSGIVHVYHDGNDIHDVKILCYNQSRLRGDYEDVFDNYSKPHYVAPVVKIPDSFLRL